MNAPIEKVRNQIFNVGYQNLSIKEIALIVKKIVENNFPEKGNIEIVTTTSDDNRSYHINSDKIKEILNFVPKLKIEDAVQDLCNNFKLGNVPNSLGDDKYYNVKKLQKINAR
jgi:nucleoside-diphosphate-sugar epimerase